MTPNWPWTCYSDRYSACMKDLPLGLNFWSVSLYDHWFSRYKVPQNQKSTECSQTEIEHLTVKTTLYTPNAYHRGPNIGQFCSTTSSCQATRSSKNRKCTEWRQTELEHLAVKTLNIYIWRPNFGPFHSATSRFGESRFGEIRNTQNGLKLNLKN